MDYDRLRELQEKFEENPRRYFAPLANEYRKGGQPKRAIEICRSQLSQMPGHMSGQIVYGQSLYESGEFDEARQVFERALTLDPENLIALRSLGDMSLQSGNTVEARKWYTRLLDADPKDAVVIALVSEIDASTDAKPVPTPQEIPGIDVDGGDQLIPFIADAEGAPVGADTETSTQSAPEAATPLEPRDVEAPPERASVPEPIAVSTPEPPPTAMPGATPPAGLERHYPIEPAEVGLPDEGLGAQGLRGSRQDEPMGAEGLLGHEPELPPEPVGTEGLHGKPPTMPLAGAKGSRLDDENALETWAVPSPGATEPERAEIPPAPVETPRGQAEIPRGPSEIQPRPSEIQPGPSEAPREHVEAAKEERVFSGPGPEPFVNETMAQLYLQQGYMQLALRVYYQLAESRPDDRALKNRIAEIEAADRAAHPDAVVQGRRESSSVEKTSGEPAQPRTTSAEPPAHRDAPVDYPSPARRDAPVDYPAPSQPARHRQSVEAPVREEPRAEPEGIAARQPSVREFFATLGRRRPSRSAGNQAASARPGNNMPAETAAPLGNSAPSASLDAVFAGATVSPADSRAASRLAGAFSGSTGAPRATPPTPPMPTPRVSPRMPQTQESEEDVAKFRAWLDGLTGE